MMVAQKEVKVKVATEKDLAGVTAIEQKIAELKKQKIDLKIQTNQNEIANIDEQIAQIKREIQSLSATELDVRTNTNEINKLVGDIEKLEGKKVDLNLDIEKSKLDSVKSEVENLDGTTIDVDVNNISAMEAVDQIGQGFDRLKQGASEVGEQLGSVLESAGKQETNFSFLQHALNNDEKLAKQKMADIADIVQKLPGDDTAVQGLLSQAIAKDASLSTDILSDIGTAYADYASAMSFYGKSGIEAQQDMTNYILAGNTAELERSPILASHIDKLKEANTIQERAEVLQEALNEEHWGGMSQQDTYNNKLETFNGMLERGKYNLGGMFQEGAKWGMDFLLDLDEATGGLVGMGIALGSFASPLTDTVMGLGQIATGMNAIKDLGFLKWLKDLEIFTKLSAAADWLLSGAQAVLNFVMEMNPIFLVVIALVALVAALVWAYYNVDWFREMVDNAFASLVQIGQIIYSYVAPVIQWLSDLFNSFTSQLGLNTTDWIQAVLGFILFLPTLPMQLGIALVNALAKALGFKGNFVQTLFSAASNAVTSFYNAVTGIPKALQACLDWAYNLVMSHPLVQALVWLGQQAVNAFSVLGLGQGSPGDIVKAMKNELNWTRDAILDSTLIEDSASLGEKISSNFNPDFTLGETNAAWLIDDNKARSNNPSLIGEGTTIINVYGDVDSEKRVREIVEAVKRELSFNNATAGRTV